MSMRDEQRRKVCRILDDVLANRPTERDALIAAVTTAFDELKKRKTGTWVWSEEDASWKCGSCDCVFEEIDWKPEYNYCPNCGARMSE